MRTRTFKTGILVASVIAVMALGACSKGNKSNAAKSPTEVKVNGKAITQAGVDMVIKQRLHGQPSTPETRAAIIDGLVLETVVAQQASKLRLDKSPEYVEQMEAIRRSALANAYVEDWIKKNPVTDEMLKAEYERQMGKDGGGVEYKARHILVETEAEAKDLIAALNKAPGSFAKLAGEKSKDPGSKGSGGDLGWFEGSQMVPEFGAALAGLEKGKFTQTPVKTQFGYHIIWLEDSRKMTPPPFEAVKSQLSQQMLQQHVQKHLDELKSAAKVEVLPLAPAAASEAPAASAAQ